MLKLHFFDYLCAICFIPFIYTQAEYQKLRFWGLGSELLRGWIAGWQIFMNMFIVGWISIAMGKVCSYILCTGN